MMCDKSTACNPHWHVRRGRGCIGLHNPLYYVCICIHEICPRSTMSNVPLKHTPVKKLAILTTRSSSLRCVYLQSNSTTKLAGRNPGSIPMKEFIMEYSPRLPQESRYQVFEKLLWKRAQMLLKIHLESNVTPNISRSSDSFSTVLSIINRGGWRCIVRDLETIIVLV